MQYMMLSVFFPVAAGIFLLVWKEIKSRKILLITTGVFLAVTSILVMLAVCLSGDIIYTFYSLTDRLPILFKLDGISVVFAVMAVIVFLSAGVFSFEYMKHEKREKVFYGFYLIVFGILIALCFAGNLITFYLFYEMLTLSSFPLVLHNRSREAVMAGLKYLFYSLSGAYMILFGLYFVERYGNTLTFSAGGVFSLQAVEKHGGFLLLIAFLMILGFGVKAGMFPLHAWLSAAHPAAPAPASAVLSAVIVKVGVLGMIRAVYYIFGASLLRESWVQKVWMILTLLTIFMGSVLAYREPVLKKRLAYSTVSQVSYILFGLAIMNEEGMTGSLLHVLCHGFIKAVLFLCAGAMIYQTGKTRDGEFRGIGKEMPLLISCYTAASLGLIGIPPTGGFVSKWHLAIGSLSSGVPVFSWLGPVILLVSALLTAGYLLPITIQGFFPGEDYDYKALKKSEPSRLMIIPVLVLTLLSVLIGIFPEKVIGYLEQIIEKIL